MQDGQRDQPEDSDAVHTREDKSQGEGGGADAQYGPVGQEGCRAAVTEEVLETSRMKVTYLGGHDTVESDVQREVTRGPHAGAE